MGYGGKWRERERARQLRAQAWTLQEIAHELGVSKGTVSVWVRDVEFTPRPRNRGHANQRPHPLRLKKLAELERCREEAEAWASGLGPSALHLLALGLYAGEGSKTDGCVSMANTNPMYLLVFVTWLRRTFDVDEARLRVRLYFHEGLDLAAATSYWSDLLGVPVTQFQRPYRAVADSTRRRAKHEFGCATVVYADSLTYRRVMAMVLAISSLVANPG